MSKLTHIFSSVLGVDETAVVPSLSPANTAAWDSLNAIILLTEIEKAFDTRFVLSLPPKKKIVSELEWPSLKKFLPDLPRRHSHTANRNPITGNTYSSPSLHCPYKRSRNIDRVSIGCGFHHPLRPD